MQQSSPLFHAIQHFQAEQWEIFMRSHISSCGLQSAPDFNHYRGEFMFSFENKIFYFQKKLGSGGFGNVFLFESKNPKQQVAIKEDHNHNGFFCGGKTFEIESQWCKKIYGIGKLSGNPKSKYAPHYILMPYFPGKLLHEIQYSCIKRLLSYWMKTAHAVRGFYEQSQAIHCDLKTDNIIINTETDQAIIIDFGLMCHENEVRRIQFYAHEDNPKEYWQHAPEIFSKTAEKITATHAQDIYSLGMILISTFESFMMNSFINNPPSNTEISIRLVHSHLTHQNPSERWSIAKAIYMLATTFFSQIPRLVWLTQHNEENDASLRHNNMMTAVWKKTSTVALDYCAKKLMEEQNKLSCLGKKLSIKPEKIAGIKKLRSEIVVSNPSLFSENIFATKKIFPNLTKGIFLNRTETVLRDIVQTAQFLH